jgi:hypothetical protein
MDPKDIAKLITEDEGYDKCPVCGDEYAVVSDNSISCRKENCKNYNKEYAETLDAAESTTVKITDVDYDCTELDWKHVKGLMDYAMNGGNYRVIMVPAEIGNYAFTDDIDDNEDVEVMLLWKGSKAVSDEALRQKFIKWVETWR